VPHALAEIKKFVIKPKSFTYPSVDVFNGIMMSQFVWGGVGTIDCIPQLPKILLHPTSFMESSIPGREEIDSIRI
jgi:hypothetical protein